MIGAFHGRIAAYDAAGNDAALAQALDIEPEVIEQIPALVYDWEVREGTLGRIEDALLTLGGVTYDLPLDNALFVDRSLATAAVGADDDGSLLPARS